MMTKAKVTRDRDGRGARVEAVDSLQPRDKDGMMKCRVCGCTEVRACQPPCSWAGPFICSNCHNAVSALRQWKEGANRANMTALLRELELQWEDPFLACSRAARGARR